MVNDAGIAPVGPLADVTPEQLKRLWAINVDGVLWGVLARRRRNRHVGGDRQALSELTGAAEGETFEKFSATIAVRPVVARGCDGEHNRR